ncbi:MAG: META domain-containing protein [Gordonia sp. (in: high G+C Gram-positive bacteria)]
MSTSPFGRRRPSRSVRLVVTMAAAAALGVTAMTGCSAGDDAKSTDPAALIGKTYLSGKVDGTAIPGDGPLEVSFPTTGRISATAGCNRHNGSVAFSGSELTAGPLAATLTACPPPRDRADAWVGDFFGGPVGWSLDGKTLTLRHGETVVTLAERENLTLVGPEWTVNSLVRRQAVESSVAIEQARPRLTFTKDGRVTGFAGCNTLSGGAAVHDDKIDFSSIATTRKACLGDLDDVERAVLAVLQGPVTYAIDGDQLSLTNDADPSIGLRLRAPAN